MRILNQIKEYLKSENLSYDIIGDSEIIHMQIGSDPIMGRIEMYILCDNSGYCLVSIPDQKVQNDRRNDMAHLLCDINYALKYGCFEMDFEDGELSFRISNIIGKKSKPSKEAFLGVIFMSLEVFEDYGSRIMSVLIDAQNERK